MSHFIPDFNGVPQYLPTNEWLDNFRLYKGARDLPDNNSPINTPPYLG